MCLIAVAKKRSLIPLENLKQAHTRNKDGWGIMYAMEDRVVSYRGLGDHKEFLNVWESLPDVPIAAHFRFRTKGPTDIENCHPFKVLDAERDGQDVYVMHNGPQVARDCHGDKRRSDTLEFVQDLVSPMLRGKPRFIRTAAFRRIMQNMIDSEKLVFLEGCGKWHFANYGEGEVIDSVWYSNTYSIESAKWWKGAAKRNSGNDLYLSDGLKDHWGLQESGGGVDMAAHWGQYSVASNRWLYPEELANLPAPPFGPAAYGFVRAESGVWSVPESYKWDHVLSKWTAPAATAPAATSALSPRALCEAVALKPQAYVCPMDPDGPGCTQCGPGGDCKLSDSIDAAIGFSRTDESKLMWRRENILAMSDSELLDAVWDDADGAADAIRELAR